MSTSITKDRRSLEEWLEYCKTVENATEFDVNESEEDKQKRIKKARKDFGFFVKHYFPHYAKFPSAPFHIAAAKIILKYPVLRIVLAWFRGAAKSVFSNILIPMWLKTQETRQINTMVLVGKSQTSAINLLSDLQAELENNQRYIMDFGEQRVSGDWQEGNFSDRDNVSYFALGRKQSPRGLRKQANRPDYFVFDDIDDDELVRNEARVDDVIDWIERACIPAMDGGKGRVIVSNNIIHERSVTAKLISKYQQIIKTLKQLGQKSNEESTSYHISNVAIKDSSGKPAWPGKYTSRQITELELELGYAASQTEYYNNPITQGKVFQKDWIQFTKLQPLNRYKHLLAYFDGGFKNTGTADHKALVLIGSHKGEYHVIKAYCGKASRMEAVYWHYDLDQYLKSRSTTCVYFMEEVFLLDLLYDDFKAASLPDDRGYHLPINGDKRKKPDKDLRISSMSGLFERGVMYFNQSEENNHHMQNLVQQLLAFEPPKKTLKDGPDALEGGIYKLKESIITGEPASYGLRSNVKHKHRY